MAAEDNVDPLVFHEQWWLSATTAGRYSEVKFMQGDHLVGRLPFVITRKWGLHMVLMPPFTHVLGPAVVSGKGKHQTRLMNRLSIVRSLIDQLPPFDCFKQAIDPTIDDGLALADGLAFQDRSFQISPQYTFEIDCRSSTPEGIWEGMHFKVRQHIRRAEENCTVATVDDPHRFTGFYLDNLRKSRRRSNIQFDQFPVLLSECCARKCGTVLVALLPNGTPVAMVYLVWGHGSMYYLLSTRAPDVTDNGATSLLIWSAIKKACELGLLFDFDGIATRGIARFYSGFGGQIKTRLIVTRGRPLYKVARHIKKTFSSADFDSSDYT
jgi:lipid II:glycine glycyltransferase (peptidoglycan interpeptide bridge formation enzyme)